MCFFYTLYNVKSNSILDSVDVVLYRSGMEEIKFGFTLFLATASKFDLAKIPAYDKRML